jgi:hypothetical protein
LEPAQHDLFEPTIARLKDAGFAHVEGLLEMAALTEPPRVSPALFIVPERGAASPNQYGAGAIDQKVTETFTVVITLEAVRRVGEHRKRCRKTPAR